MSDPLINRQIRQYFLQERLQSGGMAVVYKAYDRQRRELVAFKVLRENYANQPQIVLRFRREAEIAQQLNHPHIVPFYDFGEVDGLLYMVMKFMAAGSLVDRLNRVANVSLGQSARWLRQISGALDFAHSRGIIHRDLKPGNILLANDDDAYLSDFGIAKITEATQLTSTGQSMPGTARYMSPEQAAGDPNLDHRADIYSLGVIAYLLVTGFYPFTGDSDTVILIKHLNETPPLPSQVNKALPLPLDTVLLTGLAKLPAQRYSSSSQLVTAFEKAITHYEELMVIVTPSAANPISSASAGYTPVDRITVAPGVFNVRAAVTEFYQAFDARDWTRAQNLLAQIRASGQAPSFFDVDNAEYSLHAEIRQEKMEEEYAILRLMAERESPERVWDAIQAFQEDYPGYDPDQLAEQFRPAPKPPLPKTPLPVSVPATPAPTPRVAATYPEREQRGGFPRWLIGVAVVALIGVVAVLFSGLLSGAASPQIFNPQVDPYQVAQDDMLTLSWEAENAESIVIKVNGNSIASLPGDVTSYEIPVDAYSGSILISIEAVRGDKVDTTTVDAFVYEPLVVDHFTVTPFSVYRDVQQTLTLNWLVVGTEGVSIRGLESVLAPDTELLASYPSEYELALAVLPEDYFTIYLTAEDATGAVTEQPIGVDILDSVCTLINTALDVMPLYAADDGSSGVIDNPERLLNTTLPVDGRDVETRWVRVRGDWQSPELPPLWWPASGVLCDGFAPEQLRVIETNFVEVAPSPTATSAGATLTPAPTNLSAAPPITAANIDQVTELLRIGRGTLNQVVYSPDGNTVAVASGIGVWLYDAETLATHRFIETPSRVSAVAYSPDGSRIVSGSDYPDYTARVWDAQNGDLLLTLVGHAMKVTSVAYSPDGTRIVTGSRDSTAMVWDAESGELLFTLAGYENDVWTVAYSPDGRRIVSGGLDNTMRIWDADNGDLLLTLEEQTDRVSSAAYSPDGNRIVASGWAVRIWDAQSRTVLLTLTEEGYWESAAYSPDGNRIVASGWGIRIWDAQNGTLLLTLADGYFWKSVAFSPDGRRVVAGSESSGAAQVWDADSGELLLAQEGYYPPPRGLAYSPDGRRIVTGSFDNIMRIWDAESGDLLLLPSWHGSPEGVCREPCYVAYSPDGRRIVTSNGGTAWVLDAESGELLFELTGHTDDVFGVAYSPDGTRIVTGSRDNTAKVWNAESGELLLTLAGHSDFVWGVAFSPDSERIITTSYDGTARVWNATSGDVLLTLAGHARGAVSAAYSPDGSRIATGEYGDGVVRIWDAASGDLLLTLTGPTLPVWSVAFSPDERYLVASGYDGIVRIWDAQNGNLLRALEGHTSVVFTVAFSPDGTRIISGSLDGTVRVWGVPDN